MLSIESIVFWTAFLAEHWPVIRLILGVAVLVLVASAVIVSPAAVAVWADRHDTDGHEAVSR